MAEKKLKPVDKGLVLMHQDRKDRFERFNHIEADDLETTSFSGKYQDPWESISFTAAQLTKPPIDSHKEHVDLSFQFSGRYSPPVMTDLPLMVAGMSYGALTLESKLAIHKALNILAREYGIKIFYNTGEGGVLDHELHDRDYLLMQQVASGRFNVNLEALLKADAIEIKIGQGAKPGIGGQLPGSKVTKEIAERRNIPEGVPAYSPARNMDIIGPEDLFAKIQEIRKATRWSIPIGVKFAAGDVYHDAIIASRMADFITIDGMSASTGAAPEIAQTWLGIPTMAAIVEGRKGIDDMASQLYKTLRKDDRTVDYEEVTMIASGGLIFPNEFYSAFSLGANMAAVGAAIQYALDCTACHKCHINEGCPPAITTISKAAKADMSKAMNIDEVADNIVRYFLRSKKGLELLYAANGHYIGNSSTRLELRTTSPEVHAMTGIPHPGIQSTEVDVIYAKAIYDVGGCGIAGIIPSEKKIDDIIKGGSDPLPVNEYLLDMMSTMQNRGPDSAGVAFYYFENIAKERFRFKLRFNNDDQQEIEVILKKYSRNQMHPQRELKTPDKYEKGIDIIEYIITSDFDETLLALNELSEITDLTLVNFGNYSDVIKDVGSVKKLNRTYKIDEYKDILYGLGHVRTATMSSVNPVTAHPFSTSVLPDITVVHNGEVSNAAKLKSKLRVMGYPFFAPTDSEVIASFIAERINRGYSLEDAANDFVQQGDGPYAFLIATPEGVAFVKDRFGLRPAMVGYNSSKGFYAIASENAALNKVGATEDLDLLANGGVRIFKTGIRR